MIFVEKSVTRERKAICNKCEHKRGDFKLFGITIFKRIDQCKICKCSLYAKTLLNTSECPQNKW